MKNTIYERFWSKVDIKGKNDCWNWIASIDTPGYGGFKYSGKKRNSNRIAWILTYGEIKDNLWVLHKCNNRLCCNPNHLYLGTPSDNVKDAVLAGTHCALGNNFKRACGEKHGSAILHNQEVLEIKSLLKKGITQINIGKIYGVSKRTISDIKTERTWSFIT